MNYQIGLDFGTSATKVCAFNKEKEEYKFLKLNGSDSFFFPSEISRDTQGRVKIGNQIDYSQQKVFKYFKMAALLDDDFRLVSEEVGLKKRHGMEALYGETNFSHFSERLDYHPELLCSLYLAEIFSLIFKTLKEGEKKKGLTTGFLSGLFKQKQPQDVKATFTVGFPTEFNDLAHLKRKRKMESILYLSVLLFELGEPKGGITNIHIDEALDFCNQQYDQIKGSEGILKVWEKLKSFGVFLYPEAAASLSVIRKNKSITKGHYATLDIGGGTTDISFFYYNEKQDVHYFASESLPIASNNIVAEFIDSSDTNEISSTIRKIEKLSSVKNAKLKQAELEVNSQIANALLKIFCTRVYDYFRSKGQNTSLCNAFSEKPCLVLGGGSSFKTFQEGKFAIHANSSRSKTYMNKELMLQGKNINLNIRDINIIKKGSLSRLVICLGLAMSVKPPEYYFKRVDLDQNKTRDNFADWLFVADYVDSSQKLVSKTEPHPINEDQYIKVYHIVEREWV